MQFTVHRPQDADFESEINELNDYIEWQAKDPFFKCLSTDPLDFRPTERTIIARDGEITGFIQIDLDDITNIQEPMRWLQSNASNPIVSASADYLTYQQFSMYAPFNNPSISKIGFIHSIEAYQRGAGRRLIQFTKEIADTLLLDSVNESQGFYERVGFLPTPFKIKKYEGLQSLYFWQK